MNKNVTDSWKSKKLNACADSVDQALFSAHSKEPGYEAKRGGAGERSRALVTQLIQATKSTFAKHNDLTVGDRTLLDCSSAETSVDLKLAALSHISI